MTNGYPQQNFTQPTKRYCQTLDLRDNAELIAEYRKRHSEGEAWSEILEGIREVGILEMEIYILGTRLFMSKLPSTLIGTKQWRGSTPCPDKKNGKNICLYSKT